MLELLNWCQYFLFWTAEIWLTMCSSSINFPSSTPLWWSPWFAIQIDVSFFKDMTQPYWEVRDCYCRVCPLELFPCVWIQMRWIIVNLPRFAMLMRGVVLSILGESPPSLANRHQGEVASGIIETIKNTQSWNQNWILCINLSTLE